MDKTNEELIASITVNESNFNYIAKTGKINGSLLQDIRRILDEKAQPIKERKCYIQQKLDEANELLYKNGIKERPYRIDHRGAQLFPNGSQLYLVADFENKNFKFR